jgi:glycosyltransferase involved in cell wall biosynthesis
MPESPKISIVTPSYNQAEFLEQTIVSVLDQQYPNLEYIVMDGGSSDASVSIIKKYEKYLSFWVSGKDNGQCDAINNGLGKCTGEIFNWLNSDDYYAPGVLQKVADLFSDQRTLAVCGRTRVFDGAGGDRIVPASFVNKNDLVETLCRCHIEQPSTFFRMSAVRTFGPLSPQLNYVMDKEWWLKFLFQYGCAGVVSTDEVFANFRLHPQSKTVSSGERFFSDQASLLGSLLSLKGETMYAGFLSRWFPVNTGYRFAITEPMRIEVPVLERMARSFLLWRASLVFKERDFEFSKAVMQTFRWKENELYSWERKWYADLREQLQAGSWWMFRVRRKWKSIFS